MKKILLWLLAFALTGTLLLACVSLIGRQVIAPGLQEDGAQVSDAVIREELPKLAADNEQLGEIFHQVGMRCINEIGGSAGPLFGTFFLRAGMASMGKTVLTPADWAMAFDAGTMGVSLLGKSSEGDKTMLDAMFPAGRAMQKAVGKGGSLPEVLAAGAEAAENGVLYTKTIQATPEPQL